MRTTLTESTTAETVTAAKRSIRKPLQDKNAESQSASTLIEFPGGRNVPEWRKRLSQRVREIQEQKAREVAEAKAATRAAETVLCDLPSGQLELVPDPEQAPLNPIVSKALERVDRARRAEPHSTGFSATAAAPALAAAPKNIPLSPSASPQTTAVESGNDSKPKLTIVAPPPVAKPEVAAPVTELAPPTSKRVRVISESVEDAALSYLETCLSVPVLSCDTRRDIASLTRRAIVGVVDLILIALMVSPAAAAIQANAGNWSDPRNIGLMAGLTIAATLTYFTVSIALTGRTLSMRLFSVRTIDARTGLIPTGGQSIKRALGYVFSFALLGLGFAFALIDRDHRTLHDRFSRTIVVHD
ncbi:MAG TPA: RDD family protein [Pyrinomonadaceae bacterium]|nr:RDD family protein [Pyrinomonadaceae bacterium]